MKISIVPRVSISFFIWKPFPICNRLKYVELAVNMFEMSKYKQMRPDVHVVVNFNFHSATPQQKQQNQNSDPKLSRLAANEYVLKLNQAN